MRDGKPVPCLFYCRFLFAQGGQCEIDAVKHKADTEYGKHHHKGHDLIREERKNAGLDKEPVIAPVIHGVTEGCPHKDHEDPHKLFPDFANVIGHIPVGEIQHAPAEQKGVVHKGLEDNIAEWRLAAQGCAGVAHPHKAGGDGKGDHRLTDFGKLRIELDEWHQHCHNGTNIKGQLVGADAVIAVRQGHDEKVDDIQPHSQVCHDTLQPGLLPGEFAADQRQRQGAAKGDKQVKKMPSVKQTDLQIRIILAEQPRKKFFHRFSLSFPGKSPDYRPYLSIVFRHCVLRFP